MKQVAHDTIKNVLHNNVLYALIVYGLGFMHHFTEGLI